MSLKLMYITNRPDVALIAEAAGVRVEESSEGATDDASVDASTEIE